MEKTLYGFILKHSKRDQVTVLAMTLAAFPFLYMSLDLPKTIINRAISGKHFPVDLFGFQLEQIPYLVVLCMAFLFLVLINGLFKYTINTSKGRMGERMLRRLRYELYSRVLRFPPSHFRRVSPGEIIPMITQEVEPLGGFIGDAVAQPIFQGGQLLTIATFMFVQDWVLGLAAVSLYPVQFYVIPKLQKKVNALAKLRVREIRQLSGRINESVAGIEEIRTHDASNWRRADFTHVLGGIYDLRFEIYQRKFFIKFLNNFINQLTPFFFYLIGGYLIIKGDLSLGAMVAVLAAYKDMSAPWKELLAFYQQKEDSRIKYEQVIAQFDPPGMIEADLQLTEPEKVAPFDRNGQVVVSGLTLSDDDGAARIENANFTFGLSQHVAIVGPAGSGKEELGLLLARLWQPTSGRITIDGRDLAALPEAVLGRRTAYVGSNAYLFAASIRDNLVFGLRHRPVHPAPEHCATPIARLHAATQAGNSADDLMADWIDYEAAGIAGPEALPKRLVALLEQVGLGRELFDLGLRGSIDPEDWPDLAARILEARTAFRERLSDPQLKGIVEPFDPDRYNRSATLAENLLFGTPVGPVFETSALATNDYVRRILERVGLVTELTEMGRDVAAIMVELFAGLDAGHELMERYSFIKAEELPDFEAIVARAERLGLDNLTRAERDRLLGLPFRLITDRHRLGMVDETFEQRIVEARRLFAAELPDEMRPSVAFFDPDAYNAAASLQDNILFGRISETRGRAAAKVGAVLAELIDHLGMRDDVVQIGLDYQVGIGGSRLTYAQRQRLALGRCLLKRPDLLIVNGATAALEASVRAELVAAVEKEMEGRALVWILEQPSLANTFDRVIVVRERRIVQQGHYDQLAGDDGMLRELIAAE